MANRSKFLFEALVVARYSGIAIIEYRKCELEIIGEAVSTSYRRGNAQILIIKLLICASIN